MKALRRLFNFFKILLSTSTWHTYDRPPGKHIYLRRDHYKNRYLYYLKRFFRCKPIMLVSEEDE